MKKYYIFVILSFIIISTGAYFINFRIAGKKDFMILNYIVTETGIPDSFDPLWADKSNNILMMRMLYYTPLQINSSNELVSNVFEKFEYDANNFILKFTTKKFIGKYSDGTEIDKRDILLAILRVAYLKPGFPVIKDIVGVEDWSEKKKGLYDYPAGISFDENEIKIKLNRHSQNALFRFCLELFSIIPSRCIDLSTGKLLCDRPPYSGYYELESANAKEYRFKLRVAYNNFAENIGYKSIIFQYKSFLEACSTPLEKNSIISGTDIGFNSADCSTKFKVEQLHWLPSSRFGAVLFNPNVKPFNSSQARRMYANKIREHFSHNKPNMVVKKSLFSHLLPGYIDDSGFFDDKTYSLSDKTTPISIASFTNPVAKMVSESIERTSQELNIPLIKLSDDVSKNTENFLSNKLGYLLSASGFWPQDPIGDISMYFTKNLHPPLKFVWQDKKMYELIKLIEDETDPLKVKNKMEDLNRHLYEESLIAPIIHFRRLYITHESVKSLNLPMAVTSPAPWHLIPTE